MDYTIRGILLARILEQVVIAFSRGSFQPRDLTQVSVLQADSLPSAPQSEDFFFFSAAILYFLFVSFFEGFCVCGDSDNLMLPEILKHS